MEALMARVWRQCSSQVAISASTSGHRVDAGITGNCSAFSSGAQGCEIDHLISLELGVSNDPDKPQQCDNKEWNVHIKDDLENTLHRLVCRGSMTLSEARNTISKVWIVAFRK
jgi:hypothetical protein